MPVCEACSGANEGASQDKTKCLSCAGGSTFNAVLKDCTCPVDQIVVERATTKECDPCASEAYPGPADGRVVTECKLCPFEGQGYNNKKFPWKCECDAGNTFAQYSQAGEKCYFTNMTE